MNLRASSIASVQNQIYTIASYPIVAFLLSHAGTTAIAKIHRNASVSSWP